MVTKAYQLQLVGLNQQNKIEVCFSDIIWYNYKDALNAKLLFQAFCFDKKNLKKMLETNIITLEVR
jgi:hypothetical protein